MWTEHKGKCYYLVLQHYPPEVKTELKNLERWEAAVSDTGVVFLLLIIRDVLRTKRKRAQSTMGLVESDAALYITRMNGADTLDKHYRVFKAWVDTIKVHSGNTGYRGPLAQEHLDAYMVKKVYDLPE